MSIMQTSAVGLVVSAGLLSTTAAHAKIVENDLQGNVQFDGWDQLGGIPGYGIGDVGPIAPPNTPWPAPIGSNEAGSGDAFVTRTFGTHYSASSALYSFAGPSGFLLGDATAIAGLANVVFSVADWVGDSPTGDPVLNYNGGSQALVADFTSVSAFGSIDFNGTIDINARTFQWDLSSLGPVTDFAITWTQGSSAGITALQLEQSDVFSLASATPVPHPSTAVVVLGGMLAARRRRA